MQGGVNGGSHALLFGSRCEPYYHSKHMVEDERSYTYSTSMLSVMISKEKLYVLGLHELLSLAMQLYDPYCWSHNGFWLSHLNNVNRYK